MAAETHAAGSPVLFGIDVHSIQRYLFATSKLREIVGASQIVSDLTCAWVLEELDAHGLRDETGSEDSLSATGYLPVRIGGGATRLVLPNAEAAVKLARAMNRRAVERAPGLHYDIGWVPFDVAGDPLFDRNSDVIELLSQRRNRPRGGGRFPGFPFTAPCRLTFDPAAGYGEEVNERLCEASLAKRWAQEAGRGDGLGHVRDHEVVKSCGDPDMPFEFELSLIADDDSDNSYVAVVCVDLNRLGEKGQHAVGDATGRSAAVRFHSFTEEVKAATSNAFAAALSSLPKDPSARRAMKLARQPGRRLPIRPLVMGGDDLVFVMHASCGIPFAIAMLESFDDSGFAGAAGIVFVKAKSPFSRAVNLAEQLVASAKDAGREDSRIDFTVCTGEIPGDIGDYRASAAPDVRLRSGPWTVSGFRELVRRARLLADLPRSHVRRAVDRFHVGFEEGQGAFRDLLENLRRRIGGRPGRRSVTDREFTEMYPTGFFGDAVDGVPTTDLVDCVDLFRFVVDADEKPMGALRR